MTYPQAPWALQGYAFLTVHLVDVERVRPLIPAELGIISVLPGKTLGGIYLSSYESGSVLQYNELIAVAAVVSYKGKFGSWVSHIYVDHPDSVAGGREIWGLPKQLAEFSWDTSSVTVSQGNQQLCSLTYHSPSFGWRLPLSAFTFSALGSNLLHFKSEVESQLSLVTAKLAVPLASPMAALSLSQPLVTLQCDRLQLKVAAPTVVGQTAWES